MPAKSFYNFPEIERDSKYSENVNGNEKLCVKFGV